MKKRVVQMILTVVMAGTMFAGCATKQEVADKNISNEVADSAVTTTISPTNGSEVEVIITSAPTEESATTITSTPVPTEGAVETSTEADTTEPTVTQAATPTATPTIAPTSTPEPTATPTPTATPMPTATPTPTSTPTPTVTPLPTSTPTPTATPLPTATPKPTATPTPKLPQPTPSIEEIKGPVPQPITYKTYTCGEKGEEVLELIKSFRKEHPDDSSDFLISYFTEKYDYTEEEILYGVYNSGWVEECIEVIKLKTYDNYHSEYNTLTKMVESPYIEEDIVYAIKNCGIDWNERAFLFIKNILNRKRGNSFYECVEMMKDSYFTNEQIEYALKTANVDWSEQALLKCKYYINGSEGIAYTDLIKRLVESHHFDEAISIQAAESIKNDVDWNQEAVEVMRWFKQGGHSRERLIEILQDNNFTKEQIEYALKVVNP